VRIFLDTSSLIKKYVQEDGSGKLDDILEGVREIAISPITWLEIHSAIERRLSEKTILEDQALWIKKQVQKDFNYFFKVIWNESLENQGVELIQKYRLKTLDSLQLASGMISQCDVFITSDRKMHAIAEKEMENTNFI
jgi:hypothetical protein